MRTKRFTRFANIEPNVHARVEQLSSLEILSFFRRSLFVDAIHGTVIYILSFFLKFRLIIGVKLLIHRNLFSFVYREK